MNLNSTIDPKQRGLLASSTSNVVFVYFPSNNYTANVQNHVRYLNLYQTQMHRRDLS